MPKDHPSFGTMPKGKGKQGDYSQIKDGQLGVGSMPSGSGAHDPFHYADGKNKLVEGAKAPSMRPPKEKTYAQGPQKEIK